MTSLRCRRTRAMVALLMVALPIASAGVAAAESQRPPLEGACGMGITLEYDQERASSVFDVDLGCHPLRKIRGVTLTVTLHKCLAGTCETFTKTRRCAARVCRVTVLEDHPDIDAGRYSAVGVFRAWTNRESGRIRIGRNTCWSALVTSGC